MLYTRPEKPEYMDFKGLELARRDNCALVRNCLDKTLQIILKDRDVPAAVVHVQDTVRRLLKDEIDISQLVITKAFNKNAEDMKAIQPHVVLVSKMQKRDALTAPKLGDRVKFVYTMNHKKAKGFERVEDPIFVLKNNIPIDYQYYLDHQLSLPLLRIFDAIMPNAKSVLFSGEHMQSKRIVTPTAGGIASFVKKMPTCLACKVVLKSATDTKSICSRCESDGAMQRLYLEAMSKLQQREADYNKLWTNCQRCTSSLHLAVACSNSECPVFYRRTKAQIELKEAQLTLSRFSAEW
jgi:DNA polymerase delta subunit 1